MENTPTQAPPVITRVSKRSFLCTIVLAIALTYFLILALFFLGGLLFYNSIINAITPYLKPEDPSTHLLFLFLLIGTLLFFAANTGIILIFLRRKKGFYLFVAAAILIFILDLGFLQFDWMRYLIHSGLIFTLGIAHFSGRCYQ